MTYDDFYAKWSKTLTENCIPHLRTSFSSDAPATGHSAAIDLVLRHLEFYYDDLHRYGDSTNIHNLLFPSGRNSLESSSLFIGDIDPYLLTNLIRSFIDRVNKNSNGDLLDLPAWKDPTLKLVKYIDWIECTIKLAIPGLLVRMREAQNRSLARASDVWVESYHSSQEERRMKTVTAMEEAAKKSANELVSIFRRANQLRKVVILGIVKATKRQQTALFLEGLCEFLACVKDQDLLRGVESIPIEVIEGRDDEFQRSLFAIQHDAPEPAYFLSKPFPPPYWAPRKPVPDPAYKNTPRYTLFVGDLNLDVTDDMLGETFGAHYPSVVQANVATFKNSGRCRGFGFVRFTDENEKKLAMEEMQGVTCDNRPMRVGDAKY